MKQRLSRRQRHAYHESGHLVVSNYHGLQIVFVDMSPDEETHARVGFLPNDDASDSIDALLAGSIALAMALGKSCSLGLLDSGDLEKAFDIFDEQLHLLSLDLSLRQRHEIVRRFLRFRMAVVETILEDRWSDVVRMAETLECTDYLDGGGVYAILNAA